MTSSNGNISALLAICAGNSTVTGELPTKRPVTPFVRGIHRSPVNSPQKGQSHGALMFSLICAWTNGWINNHEADDFRCHRAHYDVTVMVLLFYGREHIIYLICLLHNRTTSKENVGVIHDITWFCMSIMVSQGMYIQRILSSVYHVSNFVTVHLAKVHVQGGSAQWHNFSSVLPCRHHKRTVGDMLGELW